MIGLKNPLNILKNRVWPVLVMCTLAAGSCSKDSSNPASGLFGYTGNFRLRIEARISATMPAHGLRVSAWSHISARSVLSGMEKQASGKEPPSIPKEFLLGLPYPNPFNPVASIRFQLPTAARISMEVLDLENILVDTLIAPQAMPAGYREVLFDAGGLAAGVYRVQCLAADTATGEILYAHSVLAVLWAAPDPDATVIGSTAADGSFETANAVLFPGLFTLPDMVMTSALGDPMGLFRFTDTVTVVLADTASHQSLSYDRVLLNAPNTYRLLWDPPGAPEKR